MAKLLEDAEYFGASAEQLEKLRLQLMPHLAPGVFQVHPDNATAVRLFQALATQWRMVSITTMDRAEIRQVGLEYGSVEVTARLRGLELGPDDFLRLQVMEIEALTAWAEARR